MGNAAVAEELDELYRLDASETEPEPAPEPEPEPTPDGDEDDAEDDGPFAPEDRPHP
jgi:hypothetical protein